VHRFLAIVPPLNRRLTKAGFVKDISRTLLNLSRDRRVSPRSVFSGSVANDIESSQPRSSVRLFVPRFLPRPPSCYRSRSRSCITVFRKFRVRRRRACFANYRRRSISAPSSIAADLIVLFGRVDGSSSIDRLRIVSRSLFRSYTTRSGSRISRISVQKKISCLKIISSADRSGER